MSTNSRRFAAACAVMLAFGGAAFAQPYPNRPVRIVDGFPPGGGTDLLSRTLGQKMSEAWGQPVIVDNRPGAASNLGAQIAAKAASDGYTYFMGLVSVLAPSMTLYPKLQYNLLTDLAPVSKVASGIYVLVATPSLPVKSVQELIALAKKKEGALTYSSSGVATPAHLAGELFNLRGGVKILHVPYKGGAPAAAAIATGEAQLSWLSVPAAMPLLSGGKAKALAVTPKRTRAFPDVPTVAESGLPGFEVTIAYGVFAPAGTPAPAIAKVNAEIARVLKMPDVVERLSGSGLEADASTPEQFGRLVNEEVKLWAKVIKDAKITID
ncbi:MAG: extra-cytoplasmic solute receptor [Betaproteobacteria bacterium]|nr:extra-cytoplasmic solute receptor [Betaproteobacteria bacterium]